MTKPADFNRYRHMLDHAEEAVSLSQGRTREDLDKDRTLNLSLTRLLEIVGEAASRISKEGRANCPEIPWSQVVSMRNRLIHGYDAVDLDILWEIVTHDLPPLINALKSIISKEQEE